MTLVNLMCLKSCIHYANEGLVQGHRRNIVEIQSNWHAFVPFFKFNYGTKGRVGIMITYVLLLLYPKMFCWFFIPRPTYLGLWGLWRCLRPSICLCVRPDQISETYRRI